MHSSGSPMKIEDKLGADFKEEDLSEEYKLPEVTRLPMPEPMPRDEHGKLVDTRIPADLKPPKKPSSSELSAILQVVLTKHIKRMVQSCTC